VAADKYDGRHWFELTNCVIVRQDGFDDVDEVRRGRSSRFSLLWFRRRCGSRGRDANFLQSEHVGALLCDDMLKSLKSDRRESVTENLHLSAARSKSPTDYGNCSHILEARVKYVNARPISESRLCYQESRNPPQWQGARSVHSPRSSPSAIP